MAKVHTLERPLLGVHSFSMEQTNYLDHPERFAD